MSAAPQLHQEEREMSDRDLLRRVDERSMQMAEEMGRILREHAEMKTTLPVMVADAVRREFDPFKREIRAAIRSSKHNLRELAADVEELEDTKVRELRSELTEARKRAAALERRSSGWVTWLVRMVLAAAVGALIAAIAGQLGK